MKIYLFFFYLIRARSSLPSPGRRRPEGDLLTGGPLRPDLTLGLQLPLAPTIVIHK